MNQTMTSRKVTIHYIGTLDNGRIFDSTQDDQPLEFTLGAGEVFPALEAAVAEMGVGEVRNIVIPACDAYGPRLQENIISISRKRFPAEKQIRVGQKLSIQFGGSDHRVMVVSAVTDTAVTLDGNHPLAGLDLTFALKLESVS